MEVLLSGLQLLVNIWDMDPNYSKERLGEIMSKVAVVYWSGTGNTQAMAEAAAEGINKNGGEASIFNCTEFSDSMMDSYDAIAFGCPSMGAEELEEICINAGAQMACDFVICNEAPDDKGVAACEVLGAALA